MVKTRIALLTLFAILLFCGQLWAVGEEENPGWGVLNIEGNVKYTSPDGKSGPLMKGQVLPSDGTQIVVEEGHVRLYNAIGGAIFIQSDSRVELGEKVIVYSGVAHIYSARGRSFNFGIPILAPISDMQGGGVIINRQAAMFCLHPHSFANTLAETQAAMFEAMDEYACWHMVDGLWEPVTPPEAVKSGGSHFFSEALSRVAIDFEKLPGQAEAAENSDEEESDKKLKSGSDSQESAAGGGQSMCLEGGGGGGTAGGIGGDSGGVSIERGKTRVKLEVKWEK